MTVHNYRPRQFHRTSVKNLSSGYRDIGSTRLAATRPATWAPAQMTTHMAALTVMTIPLQPGGLRGKKDPSCGRKVMPQIWFFCPFFLQIHQQMTLQIWVKVKSCYIWHILVHMWIPVWMGSLQWKESYGADMISSTDRWMDGQMDMDRQRDGQSETNILPSTLLIGAMIMCKE